MTEWNVVCVHEAADAVLGHLRGQFVSEPGLIARRDGTGVAYTRHMPICPRAQLPAKQQPAYDAAVEMECAMLRGGTLPSAVSLENAHGRWNALGSPATTKQSKWPWKHISAVASMLLTGTS